MEMDFDEVLQQALNRGEDGDWEGMAQELGEALEGTPEDPTILCWLGVAEREMGLQTSAYDRFREALVGGPEDPHILAVIGNGLAQFDDPDAEGALRSAALLGPQVATARWMYGAYLAREGLFEEGLRELEAAAGLVPDDPVVAYELGAAYALQGDLDKALDPLTRSVDLESGDGWSQVVMGLVEAELDRLEEASRDLSEGARLRPEDVEVQLLASLVAEAAGWEDLAYEMLERGRQLAEEGDLPLLEAVESQLHEGGSESLDLLKKEIFPGALRERLMTRL
jgi:tetratricopeptide (TPR) repeat protein